MPSNQNLNYAIIGGGIAGLTLAIALHHCGVSVKIYEQASRFGEIGAGVSFTPNAVQAMKLCHTGVHEAFEKVCTRNLWPSKQQVWFDYYDGQTKTVDPISQKPAFSISNNVGQNGVHRAHFLDELVKLVPSDLACFGKRLNTFERNDGGDYTLFFADGSTAKADAILACDGIKSKVRQCLFGADHPCAPPSYTHKYAYRALVPMDDAVASIGKEKAQNAGMHMGKGGHVLTFPVNHGQTLNVVAFHTTSNDWLDHSKLTAPATRQDALKDFADFGPTVTSLLQLAKPDLDTASFLPIPCFHRADQVVNSGPFSTWGKARHLPSPKAACASSATLHTRRRRTTEPAPEFGHSEIERALEVYDAVRRERGESLVQSSRRIGDTYEWMADGIGADFAKIEAEINHRNGVIANVNVGEMCETAQADLAKRCA
ncbi:hypothetical protein AK830_g1246 [Neonectria ditissima]|uniref:FAD-binding domain-containing protein n=1 Tax=Neonectria ditissima TaxID=78410 RepID=A0A0P7BJA2_9HYPO|nr:hypothetical protein AK830_g1246 [Neonectria ditissima]